MLQVHLRHLVGGRARSYMGEMPHEKIYQVEFPERPGALKKFLSVLQPQWNITLFHYRRSGELDVTLAKRYHLLSAPVCAANIVTGAVFAA